MRVLAIILVVVAISATNVSVQARGCGTRCLEGRIADLQAQIAQLNASTVKLGQIVTINAPGGCLTWGGPDARKCLLGATTLPTKHLDHSKPLMSALGHSRPMHSVAVPINVRCYSNSDIIVRRSDPFR